MKQDNRKPNAATQSIPSSVNPDAEPVNDMNQDKTPEIDSCRLCGSDVEPMDDPDFVECVDCDWWGHLPTMGYYERVLEDQTDE